MKHIYYIIESTPSYSVNWENFFLPSNSKLILICNEAVFNSLSVVAKKRFTDILQTKDFEFNTLKEMINVSQKQHFQSGDKVTISAVKEYELMVCAQLRENFSFQGAGIATVEAFRNKLRMKEILGPKKVRIPKYASFDAKKYQLNNENYLKELELNLGFPMFAKPIDGAGSIDTKYISNSLELKEWCNAKKDSMLKFEIDEYIEGDLYHCDSLIQNGRILFTFVSKYLHPNAEAQVGKPLATMTLDSKSTEFTALKNFAEQALKAFPVLPNGCTHLEVFKKKNSNELVFLEVAARPPGGKVPEMYKAVTNVDIREIHHYLSLEIPVPDVLVNKIKNHPTAYAAMCYLVNPPSGGVVVKKNDPAFESKYVMEWSCKEGDYIKPPIVNSDSIGSLVLWNNDYKKLEKDFHYLNDYQPVTLVPKQSLLTGNSVFKGIGKTINTSTSIVLVKDNESTKDLKHG